jgi:modulator of FtsH protease HflK
MNNILQRSPWEEPEETDNIFTRSKKGNFDFNKFDFNFNYKIIIYVFCAFVVFWLASGIYEVKEGEEAAIIRFGRFARKGFPGLNYRLPTPFEDTIIEKVNQSRRIEIGYRSLNQGVGSAASDARKFINTESTMLTGDENIVVLNFDVMWHIKDLEYYIFNIINPEDAVKTAAESAAREIIGRTPLASILSNQKQEITVKIEELTQKILDQYNAGVDIEKVQLLKAEPPTEVIDAYRDVQTAKADKENFINQAQAYSNDIIPKARGESAKVTQEAEGYKQEVISKAEGDGARFTLIYQQYINNKQITKDRLTLDALEKILPGANKVIMTKGGLLPHMAIENKN